MEKLLIFVIVGLVIMFSGSTEGFFIGLLLAGIPGVMLGRALYKEAQVTKMKNSKDIEITNKQDGVIVLNRRTANNGNVLEINESRDYTIEEHPAELVYTSATVGGITTGGFHVNEAYRTESVGGKLGTYYITLRGWQDSTIVNKVRIQSDMVDSARANPIVREFLDGTTLILKHNVAFNVPDDIKKAAMEYNKAGRFDMAAKLLRPYNSVCKLTKEECEAVIAWMSNESGR